MGHKSMYQTSTRYRQLSVASYSDLVPRGVVGMPCVAQTLGESRRTGVHRLGTGCLKDTYTLLCCTSLSMKASTRGSS